MLIRVRLYLVMYNIHSIPVRLSQYSIPETRNVEELKKCFTHQSQLYIEDEVSRRVCGEW